MRIKEKFKDDAIVFAILIPIVAIMALGGFGMLRYQWNIAQANTSQQELDQRASRSSTGKFAVENFTACKEAGGWFRPPSSDALCIAETVSGAEKLKGNPFAAQVMQDLAVWLEQSKKLRSQ